MGKAERTRQHLQEVALRLFTERGFDDVTVEEIAHEAGVSHMTFYRNFPTKESAVFDDPFDPMIGAAVSAQAVSLQPIERICRGLLAVVVDMDDSADETMRARVRLALDSSALRSRIWENVHRTEEVIVDALVDGGAPSAEARVAAGAVLGAMSAALIDWARGETSTSLGECLRGAIDYLIAAASNDKEATR